MSIVQPESHPSRIDPTFVAAPLLAFKGWGEDAEVVFSPATASTHLVSAEAAVVLRRASVSPSTRAVLFTELFGASDPSPTADDLADPVTAALDALLAGLVDLGLLRVDRCPSPTASAT